MSSLFEKYLEEDKITDALLVGKNMVNRDPQNIDKFRQYMDLLVHLSKDLPALEDKKSFCNQAEITLAFFEENADLDEELISIIKEYRNKISQLNDGIVSEEQEIEEQNITQIEKENNDLINQLYYEADALENAQTQHELDVVLSKVAAIDSKISQDYLTQKEKEHYNKLNKTFTNLISKKMANIERNNNIAYNEKAVDAYEHAFNLFKSNEERYKNQNELYNLTSTTLFAFDASRLFNQTLIYYNHIYSYIFSKLNDDGRYALTRFSIECERNSK